MATRYAIRWALASLRTADPTGRKQVVYQMLPTTTFHQHRLLLENGPVGKEPTGHD